MAIASVTLPLGIVARRAPGVTRWAAWSWRVSTVVVGAGPADWALLRRTGEVSEFHVATLPLTLWATETEAYLVALASKTPSVVVVLGEETAPDARMPWRPLLVTASPYEGQDYMDSGDGLIEQVPMPDGLIAWVRDFCDAHHKDEPFIKRRRDRVLVDKVEAGKGDERIRQEADVYRAPASKRRAS